MNVTYDERRKRRRFLVIIILTLLICISGMFGVAYSALISDVRNDANVIAAEGIDAKIVDESGDILKEGDFAKNANDGAGATKLGYGSTAINDEFFGYRVWEQTLELGKAELAIKTTNNSGTKFVKIWYEVTWEGINPESEYNMTTWLTIGTGDDAAIILQGQISERIDITINPKSTFKLIGEISEAKTVDNKPDQMKYSITIFIEPA